MQNIYTRLINRNHPLPPDYVPENLVDIGIPFDTRPGDPKRLLEKKTAHAALCLINAACKEGLCLYGISGYRSYKRQQELYTGNPYVAQPGTSEHQSGLALDVSCPAVGLELIPQICPNSRRQMAYPQRISFRIYSPLSPEQRRHYRNSIRALAYPLRHTGAFRISDPYRNDAGNISGFSR